MDKRIYLLLAALFKELDVLRRNKKKAGEVPYSLILRVYDCVQAQKKELNEVNVYLKSESQVLGRKNLSGDKLGE